jgi:hypothetical protein
MARYKKIRHGLYPEIRHVCKSKAFTTQAMGKVIVDRYVGLSVGIYRTRLYY